jgi:hypothetical protein
MSGYDDFAALMGPPTPPTPPGLAFTDVWSQAVWSDMHGTIGSGWYQDRFFYLFGEGLEALAPCLEAWPFLVPPGPERMILGRNAYGALFVLENPNQLGPESRVYILNPLEVNYYQDPHLDFGGLIGYWFPNKALPPSVLDAQVYAETVRLLGRPLQLDEVLGIKVPLSLGGTLEPDNFHVENIVNYYRTTAPIYAKAFAQLAEQRKAADTKKA